MRPAVPRTLLLLALAACARPEQARPTDSALAAGDSAGGTGSAAAPRLASDATLAVFTRGDWVPTLRAAADAFAEREGVLVVIDTAVAAGGDSAYLEGAQRADLVLDSHDRVARLAARDIASWRLRFAGDRIVLAWRDSLPRDLSLTPETWWEGLLRSRVRVGRADPLASDLGRRTLLMMQLAERASGERRLALRLAQRSPARDIYRSADALGAAVDSGAIALAWTYESAARRRGWRSMPLGDAVDLGDPAHDSAYAQATIVVPAPSAASGGAPGLPSGARAGGDSVSVRGTAMSHVLTIPGRARNPSFAERFLRFLFSSDGRPLLERAPFVVSDSLRVTGRDVPAAVLALPGVSVVADSVSPAAPRP